MLQPHKRSSETLTYDADDGEVWGFNRTSVRLKRQEQP